mgnify:CR=1 FL=1
MLVFSVCLCVLVSVSLDAGVVFGLLLCIVAQHDGERGTAHYPFAAPGGRDAMSAFIQPRHTRHSRLLCQVCSPPNAFSPRCQVSRTVKITTHSFPPPERRKQTY